MCWLLIQSGDISEIVITAISTQDTSDTIMIGAYVANSGVVVAIFDSPFNTGYGGETTATDFIRNVIGPANIEGNVFGANGANLNLDLVGGRVFLIGSNFRTNTKTPDELSISSGSAVEFARVYRSALPETDIIVETGDATDIDPDYYDDHSGTLQTVANNDWSVQVIYIVVDGSFLVAYGQETFNTQTLAEQAVINGTLVYDELKQLQLQVRRMFLVVKQGATNLSDPTQAAFFTDGAFRGAGVSTSGGISGITTPGGSDTNIQFNDGGTFGGSNSFTWSDSLFKSDTTEVQLSTDLWSARAINKNYTVWWHGYN